MVARNLSCKFNARYTVKRYVYINFYKTYPNKQSLGLMGNNLSMNVLFEL